MAKQIVHYDSATTKKIKVGEPALVFPLDHTSDYVSNLTMTRTSTVVSYNKKTGEFETLNTLYIPHQKAPN